MPQLCTSRCGKKAILKRPKTGDALCKECFFWAFETEIHFTIVRANLFEPGDYVAIGASGGKEDTGAAVVSPDQKDAPAKKVAAKAKEIGGDAQQTGFPI